MKGHSTPLFDELERVPKDVGWILLITGLATEVGLPGVPPFWIAGMLILWPETSAVMVHPMQRRFPGACDRMQLMIRRYLTDLEARYPSKSGATED